MVVEKVFNITDDRRTIEIPREIPAGDVIVAFKPVADDKNRTAGATPKVASKKIRLTRKELDEMLEDCPITQRLSGILSSAGYIDLDEIRIARLAKHL